MPPLDARPSTPPELESLNGLVERVTFHNPDNGFCVLRLKVRGRKDLTTVIGHAPSISPGEYVAARGVWQTDREHGLQFNARYLKVAPPTTLEGIEKYLGSGMIKGIGPAYAGRLVKAFAEAVFDVIEQTPERLTEVGGIGPLRAKRIICGWADQKVIREIMVFLHSNGVSTSRAVRIFKTYGNDAIALVSENPYRLARDIRGIGFLSADTIAQKMGIAKTAMIRARAGISYTLTEAISEGHCGLPRRILAPTAVKLLDIPQDIIEEALQLELADGAVIDDAVEEESCVFLAGLHAAERGIADNLRGLTKGVIPWPAIDTDKAIAWAQEKLDISLSESQQTAVSLALQRKALVITGGVNGARNPRKYGGRRGFGASFLFWKLLAQVRAKSIWMFEARRRMDDNGVGMR
jgi:exodeoxyribonuclease V alpha subunit